MSKRQPVANVWVKLARVAILGLVASGCAVAVEPEPGIGDLVDPEGEVGLTAAALGVAGSVGVIPEVGLNCPFGSERITLYLDNEDDNNANVRSGWVGATEGSTNTRFVFCRVDGNLFRPVRSSFGSSNYAVLQLGTACPAGSTPFTRYFDNEDDTCSSIFPTCTVHADEGGRGDFAPNKYSDLYENLWMRFCMFRADPTNGSTTPFPAIGISYGVFGGAALPGVMTSGSWYTDDEDDDNHNGLTGDYAGSDAFLTSGKNTRLRFARVR